ncbi:hypothetical protein LTR85_010362 [Meristemomyces frigidus]|nr:hypothetical protein LTR85_010362 [Meristemomyces frigidus]
MSGEPYRGTANTNVASTASERMTDLVLGHLLLDDDNHPLYQCNVDQALEIAGLNTREAVLSCIKTPLASTLAKLEHHEHLRPERHDGVRERLLHAWTGEIITQLVENCGARRRLSFRKDSDNFRVEFTVTPLRETQEALPQDGNQSPADAGDSAIEMPSRQGTRSEGTDGDAASANFREVKDESASEFDGPTRPRQVKRRRRDYGSPEAAEEYENS